MTADSPEPTDLELIAAAVSGHDPSLTQLLRRYGPQVRATLQPLVSAKWQSALDVDDVMQITYLEAFLRVRQFDNRGDGAFLAWLMRIARNNLHDAIRELERQKRPQPDQRVSAVVGGESTFALLEQLGWTSTTPSRGAADDDVRRHVLDALAELPEDYEAVIRLYDLDGRSAAEVALELNRSEGAVYMLRARAHDCLRESMGAASQYFSRKQ